jgi:hypothetical protein
MKNSYMTTTQSTTTSPQQDGAKAHLQKDGNLLKSKVTEWF